MVWHNKLKQKKAFKKYISKELMILTWHSTMGLVHAVGWEKRSGINFYWSGWERVKLMKMLLGHANSIWLGDIETFWDQKLVWKFYVVQNLYEFYNFLLCNYLAQNVTIPQNHMLLKVLLDYISYGYVEAFKNFCNKCSKISNSRISKIYSAETQNVSLFQQRIL